MLRHASQQTAWAGQKMPEDWFDLYPLKLMLESGIRVAGFICGNLLLSGTLKYIPSPE